MTIHLNDDRDYTEIVEGWVREFFSTMEQFIEFYDKFLETK